MQDDVKQASETPMRDHVDEFWRLLETETVRILVGMKRDTSSMTYWDSASFPDDVAKALVADRRAALSATVPGVVEGWQPVSELSDVMNVGDQMDVLFGSPTWSWPILGLVTRFEDSFDWLQYDQQNDKFLAWDAEEPTLWMKRADLPALTGGEQQ